MKHNPKFTTTSVTHPEHGAFARGSYTCSCGHSDSTAAATKAQAIENLKDYHATHKALARGKANAVTVHFAL